MQVRLAANCRTCVTVEVFGPAADGTTALCAASLWGDDNMVKYLLSHGANVNAQNTGTQLRLELSLPSLTCDCLLAATLWTPLHAAAFQEHGKVIRTLMAAGADPLVEDAKGRTPQDFATISEAIWPFFQAAGCVRTPKVRVVHVMWCTRMGMTCVRVDPTAVGARGKGHHQAC